MISVISFDGMREEVTPEIAIKKVTEEGYDIDWKRVKELNSILSDFVSREHSNPQFSIDETELSLLKEIYEYNEFFNMLIGKTITFEFDQLMLIEKFRKNTTLIKRIRFVKTLKLVGMYIHSLSDVDIVDLSKKLTNEEIFAFLSIKNYVEELMEKMMV